MIYQGFLRLWIDDIVAWTRESKSGIEIAQALYGMGVKSTARRAYESYGYKYGWEKPSREREIKRIYETSRRIIRAATRV